MLKNKPMLSVIIYLVSGLVALSLLTRYWLPGGYALAGHDSGLPLDSIEFLKSRFFAWNPNIGFGVDNSYSFGSLPLHFIDLASSVVSQVLYAGNWFNIFFWLGMIFVAATVFAYNLRNIFSIYFIFFFPIFLIFNFYLSQSLFILERAKYGILIGILVFLTIVFKLITKKIHLLAASILTALTFTVFNGGSLLGISLYGNLIVIILALVIYFSFIGLGSKDFKHLTRLLLFLVLTAAFFLVLNSYQILPFLPSILNKSYLVHLGAENVTQSKDWVDYISRDVSFLNLFRMQGVPTWYSQLHTGNPEHPYAATYLNNVFFVLVSFLLPAIAFLGLILAKNGNQKKTMLLFSLVALISMPFAAGTHAPFGFIYGFLYERLPGFFIFRNPYYKFAGAFIISACFLLAASFSMIVTRLDKWLIGKKAPSILIRIGPFFVCIIIIGGWLSYHYNLLLPDKIFTWKPGFSTKIKIPEYVWDFYDWVEQEDRQDGRILLVPSLKSSGLSDEYAWGYWSLSPLTYTLASVPGLINEGDLTGEEKAWVNKIYGIIEERNTEEFDLFASRLRIGNLLLRKDAETGDIKGIENSLGYLTNIKKIRSFGEWDLYKVNSKTEPEISAINQTTLVQEYNNYLTREFITDRNVISKKYGLSEDDLAPFINQKIRTYTCQSCLLEQIRSRVDFPPVRVFSNSPLYFLKEIREKKSLELSEDDGSLIINYLVNVFRRASEIKSMFHLGTEDRYITDNVKKANLYLDEAYKLLIEHRELKTSYPMAKQILDIVNPMLDELHRFVITDTFGRRPGDVRKEVYSEIEKLNVLQEYYSGLIPSPDYLRNHKIYFLGKESGLYMDTYSLSKDVAGNLSLPVEINYKLGDQETQINLGKNDSRWVRFDLPQGQRSDGVLDLRFDLPNVFQYTKKSYIPFPDGTHGCISGKIFNFKTERDYEVAILVSQKSQRLALFNSEYDKLIDIYPIETSLPFRYIYRPESGSDSQLLICTDDRDFPEIGYLNIYEMISPSLEAVNNFVKENVRQPGLDYTQVNRTRYLITVDAPSPFILKLNQRFSPLWELYPAGQPKNNEGNHFIINGYENAWLVNANNQKEWVLEYLPQRYFYWGCWITTVSLFVFVVILVIVRKRK